MKHLFILAAALLPGSLLPLAAEELETIFVEPPAKIRELCRAPAGTEMTVTKSGEHEVLTVTGGIVSCPLTVPDGETLLISALVKGESIERRDPKNFVQGGRFGSYWSKPRNTWNSAKLPSGTFDWKPASFKIDVPLGTTRLQLQLGLKDAAGTIHFRDIRIQTVK